jgi:hypothetical protein
MPNKKTNRVNDLDLNKWKDYEDLLTDSLWFISERDKTGAHSNTYHGNFIPQIPNQLIRRFSKQGDVILDPFLGSGTSLIEAQRLNRIGIGVELQEEISELAKSLIYSEPATGESSTQIVLTGDSKSPEIRSKVQKELKKLGREFVQLMLLHPPYDDIIKFSEDPRDLSNMKSTDFFINAFGDIIENLTPLLSKNGHLAIVIGDKYSNSEWVPLGFELMNETRNRCNELKLKSTIIKNMAGNRAKQSQEQLWRYRSLSGGFYVFKHEYIFLFKKIK